MSTSNGSTWPSFKEERALQLAGFASVAGVDEAGCGALAGPVVCAAVVLKPGGQMPGVRDSKLLTAQAREKLYGEIQKRALGIGVAEIGPEEIDRINIRQATLRAMREAVLALSHVDYILVDAWRIPDLPHPQRGIIRGDQQVKCIAAASIIAKVTRDRIMRQLAEAYPIYGFAKHKGYATETHRTALQKHGLSPVHRRSFCRVDFLAKMPFN